MKLVISKNKEGNGYYTKLTNEYNNQKSEMYMSLQIPKGNDLEYGLYEVDGFLSCYTANDGTVKPKFVVTNAVPTKKYEKKEETVRVELCAAWSQFRQEWLPQASC